MAWPRKFSDPVQLAVRITDVEVSAFICGCNVFKTIVLCGYFRNNSIVSLLIAFGFMCLQDSGVATLSVVGTLWGIMLILTFWCIWTSWTRRYDEPREADQPKRTILTFEEDHTKRKEKGFKFKREDSETKPQPTGRPKRRLPFKKFRHDN